MTTRLSFRQLIARMSLPRLIGSAGGAGSDVVSSIDSELTPLLELKAQSPASLIVTVGPAYITNPVTGRKRSIASLPGGIPDWVSGTVTFPASSGGNAVPSAGASIVITVASGNFIKVGINLQSDNTLLLVAGDQGTTEALATEPAPVSGTAPAGYVTLQNVGGVIQNVTSAFVYQFGSGGGGGGSGGEILATAYDPVASVLPSGPTVTIDGYALVNGDTVLFSNLASNNNRLYKVAGIGGTVSWTAQRVFRGGSLTPSSGEAVRFAQGTLYKNQLAVFDGTTFDVNDYVRYFSGTDFWEVSSLKTVSLANNATSVVASYTVSGSENSEFHYSLSRGTGRKEIGVILVTWDGITPSLVYDRTDTGTGTGVEFTAVVSLGVMEVRATTDNSGGASMMKFSLARWSDSPGGPSGVPSYPHAGGGGGSAAGASGEVQYNNAGVLAAESRFKWETSDDGKINLNGLRYGALQSFNVPDATVNQTLITLSLTEAAHMFVDYGVTRDGKRQTGRLYVASDATQAAVSNQFVVSDGSPDLGVTFDAIVSGGSVQIRASSTATGFASTVKAAAKRWS